MGIPSKKPAASATNVRMLVVDRIGNIVKTVSNLEAGDHDITFNRGELPAGLYLYKLVGDQGASQTKEFIIE